MLLNTLIIIIDIFMISIIKLRLLRSPWDTHPASETWCLVQWGSEDDGEGPRQCPALFFLNFPLCTAPFFLHKFPPTPPHLSTFKTYLHL